MEEEIFGPILPVIGYDNLESVVQIIKERPKPLSCYIFTQRKSYADIINREVSFGGGCVNDVIMHIANHHIPFGGVGNSGIRYPPFNDKKLSFLKKII